MISRGAIIVLLTAGIAAGQTCLPDQVRVSTHCCHGAMGSLHAQVFIHNNSRKSCLLEAAPKAKAIDESGQPLPVTLEPNAGLDKYGKGSTRLILRPGHTAALTIVTGEPLYDQNRCGRRLILETSGLVVELKMLACGPSEQPLRVSVSGFYPASSDR